jgi:hypothetical protein
MPQWSGTFTSTYYPTFFGLCPLIKGTVTVDLNDDLTKIDTVAKLVYDGAYRHGETSNYKFATDNKFVQGEEMSPIKGSGTQQGIANYQKNSKSFSFNASNILTNQVISFKTKTLGIDKNNVHKLITGTYSSSNPYDIGTFSLTRD